MEQFPAAAMKKSAWIKREDDTLEDLATEVHAARPFTPEEDAVVVALQQQHPNEWATIAGNLPGRTDNAIKNRWNSALRKQQETTLTLSPLVPGDLIRVEHNYPAPAVVGHAGGGGGGDRCLILFPLAPGDIFRGNASGANVP